MTLAICVHTIIAVTNSFDPAKDAVNQAKHGVSLAIADQLEWDTAITWPDVRLDYGEPRMAGIGYIANGCIAGRSSSATVGAGSSVCARPT